MTTGGTTMDDLHLDDRRAEEPGEEPKKIWGLAIAILAILAVVATLYYFFFMKKPKMPAAAPAAESALPAEAEKAPAAPGLEPLAFPAVPLVASDPAVREFAAALSADPEFAKWLLTKDLIQKFVVSVDNVANGLSPKSHIDFYSPAGPFRLPTERDVRRSGGLPRYAAVVGGLSSAAAAARLYRAVDPSSRRPITTQLPGVDFGDTPSGHVGASRRRSSRSHPAGAEDPER
jgi:hypothetical protein